MLILKRELNETIRIGDDIELIVTRITGDSVWIGVKAPREILVLRGELEKHKQQEEADHA